MAAAVRVPDDGRVVLPPEVAREIGIEPGATVTFRTVGPYTAEISVLPTARPVPQHDERPGDTTERGESTTTTRHEFGVTPQGLPRLTLAELIERDPIEGPIDEITDDDLFGQEIAPLDQVRRDLPRGRDNGGELEPMTWDEVLARFRITGSIDEEALGVAWQDEAVKDVIGE